MGRPSPIRNLHALAEATSTAYPPPGSLHGAGADPTEIVANFGDPEGELAAISLGAGLLDATHRGVIETHGSDRLEFLGRMLTNAVRDLPPGRWINAFWLNRKGRIRADLRVLALPGRTLLETDDAAIPGAIESLAEFVIADDVTIRDARPDTTRLSIVGPLAAEALARLAVGDDARSIADLSPGAVAEARLADADCVVFRDDSLGIPAYELVTPRDLLPRIHRHILEAGAASDELNGPRVRAVGIDALESLRVHAARPAYLIDFGAESLPHETGVLRDRVSFTKGCYLGQEIVARMESLGKPKQIVVALECDSHDAPSAGDLLFPAGSQTDSDSRPDAVGVITSSAAGFDGAHAVALAQVRTQHADHANKLRDHNGRSYKINLIRS